MSPLTEKQIEARARLAEQWQEEAARIRTVVASLEGRTITEAQALTCGEWQEMSYGFVLTLDDGRTITIEGQDDLLINDTTAEHDSTELA